MKVKPLFDRVVLKPEAAQTKTQSGLIIPESTSEKPSLGKIISVGNGTGVDGKETKMQVKPGDKVIYSRFGGIEFKADDEQLIIIKQTDILAILEDI